MSHPGQHAGVRPDATALIRAEDGATISWRELDDRAVAAANRLHDLGLRPGSALAICLENRFEFAIYVWAAQYAGFRYTPVSTRLGLAETEYILEDSGAEAVVCSTRTQAAAQAAKRVDGSIPVVDVDAVPSDASESTDRVIARYERSEGVGMLYSSGTTGRPKGVRRPAPPDPIETLPPTERGISALLGIDTDSVYLSTAPLYHAAPLTFLLWMGRLGAATVVMDRFDATASLAAIERYGVTHSQWVPTMFVRLLRLPEEERSAYDLSSHRAAIHGAAPCSIALKEQMLEWWGPIIHEYYAGTEGAGTLTIGPEEWIAHKGSIGRAGDRVQILDESGARLPVGAVGEIWFEDSAPFVYHNDSEKTESARKADGRGTFGDLGYLDEDGYLYLTDRKAYTIIAGGINVYPQEVEDVLQMHPHVVDVAVFGIPNEEYGEEVKAAVQLTPGTEGSEAVARELLDYCRGKLASFKCPRSIHFEDELPREATGKLYKRLLRDRYLQPS